MKPPVSEPKKKDEVEDSSLSLRIFIGGIDPLNGLTSQMVLDRLPNTVSDVRLGTTYLHCTVPDAAQRAIVQRTLHNVKWKQCKLSVENSKDDFLTRLQKERTSTTSTTSTTTPATTAIVATDTTTTTTTSPTVHQPLAGAEESLESRRHWRVKRRFGAPMVLVDTRPKLVATWADLTAHRGKKQYRNRSFHFKFHDDTAMTHDAQKDDDVDISEEGDSVYTDSESGGSEASSSRGDSSEASSSRGDTASLKQPDSSGRNESSYVWSSSSDNELSNDDDESLDDTVVDEQALGISNSNKRYSPVQKLKSDNETVSVDDAASIVSSESDEQLLSSGSDSGKSDRDESDPEAIDFSEEMVMNESILAQLFPDYYSFPADTSQKPLDPTQKKRKNRATAMIRYDPTDQSAQQKYELSEQEEDNDEPCKTGDNDQSNGKSLSDDKKGESYTKETETNAEAYPKKVTPPVNAYVYEQGKLESVFKESREQAVTMPTQPGVFAFGFELPDSMEPAATPVVVVPHEEMVEDEPVKNAVEKTDMSQSMPGTLETAGSNAVDGKGPTLFEFPTEEVLDSLTRKFFYGFDDGKRIAEDLAEWRNDPKVRESWLERRAALTLDWKRKRKAALSQRTKRDERQPPISRPRSVDR